jgi:hypothetical protein
MYACGESSYGKGNTVQREDRVQQLVDDFQNGYLPCRGFFAKAAAFGLTAAAAMGLLGVPRTQRTAVAQDSVQPKQWEQGKGWGWVWGMTTSSATSTS